MGVTIHGQTELAAAPAENDELPIYDASVTAGRRITVINFLSALASALTSFAIHNDNLPENLDVPALAADDLTLYEQSADPPDPAEGSFVIWMSDGTGSGDDGDIMIKITAGATTKTITLVDFSAF